MALGLQLLPLRRSVRVRSRPLQLRGRHPALALRARRPAGRTAQLGCRPELFGCARSSPITTSSSMAMATKFRRTCWGIGRVGEPSRWLSDVSFARWRGFPWPRRRRARARPDPLHRFPARHFGARINLNITRRSHATVPGSSDRRRSSSPRARPRSVSNPHEGIERWFEPGSELLVVHDAAEATETYRALLADPAQAQERPPRPERLLHDEHTYAHRARRLLQLLDLGVPGRRWLSVEQPAAATALPGLAELRRVAIVPALNEEVTIPRVIDELRAFDPASTSSSSTTLRRIAPPPSRRTGRARVLRLPFNLGIGSAVQTGSASPSRRLRLRRPR